MLSSSKGRVPQSKAYRITPMDHTSTSAPAYRLPLITYQQEGKERREEGGGRECKREKQWKGGRESDKERGRQGGKEDERKGRMTTGGGGLRKKGWWG